MKEGATTSGPGPASARLAELFAHNGYFRRPNMKRRRSEKGRYRKGWEARLILRSEDDLADARRLSEQAGMRTGKPFRKHTRWVLPFYGKQAVEFFPRKRRVRK